MKSIACASVGSMPSWADRSMDPNAGAQHPRHVQDLARAQDPAPQSRSAAGRCANSPRSATSARTSSGSSAFGSITAAPPAAATASTSSAYQGVPGGLIRTTAQAVALLGEPGGDVLAGLVLGVRGDRVLQVEDDRAGPRSGGLREPVRTVTRDEQQAGRCGQGLARNRHGAPRGWGGPVGAIIVDADRGGPDAPARRRRTGRSASPPRRAQGEVPARPAAVPRPPAGSTTSR